MQYITDHASEAISHFGITSTALAEKLQAREGVLNIQANLATAASAAPTPKPLDPVPDTRAAVPILNQGIRT
jgi:hypothetical protein